MAFYTDIVARPAFSLNARIIAAFVAFKEGAEQRAKVRQTIRELSALSNRELADLGIHRSGIRAIATATTHGDK